MEALVLHGVGDLRLEQIPVPHLAEGDVRVRIGFCGVCGSDIPRIFVKGTYSFPTVCGHEFAGIVDACGPGVGRFYPRGTLSSCFRCSGVGPVRRVNKGSMSNAAIMIISAHAAMVLLLNMSSHRKRI